MNMKRLNILISAAFIVTAVVCGETGSGEEYTAQVTEKGTRVYSGPSERLSYICTELDPPAIVRVTGKRSNRWLAVRATKGCYSVIRQGSVTIVPGAKTARGKAKGVIVSDSVTVFAAGDRFLMRKTKPRGFDGFAPQTQLNKGDVVEKLGQAKSGDTRWYIITPPKDALFFIRADKLKTAPAAGADEKEPIELEPVVPEKEPDIKKTDEKLPKEKIKLPAERPEDKAGTAVNELQDSITKEMGKPLEQRNFEALLTAAENIEIPPDSNHRENYAKLLQVIKDEIEISRTTREVDSMADRALRESAVSEPVVSDEDEKPIRFDLQGILKLSELYNMYPGRQNIFRIIDPNTKKTIGHAVDAEGDENLPRLVGNRVGLSGRFAYDPKARIRVLKVATSTVLEVLASEPEPEPEPVKPEPEPVKPEPEPVKPEPEPVKPEPEPVKPEPEPVKPEPEPVKPEPVPAPEKLEPELIKPTKLVPEKIDVGDAEKMGGTDVKRPEFPIKPSGTDAEEKVTTPAVEPKKTVPEKKEPAPAPVTADPSSPLVPPSTAEGIEVEWD